MISTYRDRRDLAVHDYNARMYELADDYINSGLSKIDAFKKAEEVLAERARIYNTNTGDSSGSGGDL